MPEQRSPEAKKRRQAKHRDWIRKTYDLIQITCPKGRKAVYMDTAQGAGKSLNKWIVDLLEQEAQKSEES
jgi:hypothetical protein